MSAIRKIIIAITILGLFVVGLFVFEPFRSEPPTPIVTAENTKISTTQSSYCWHGLQSSAFMGLV